MFEALIKLPGWQKHLIAGIYDLVAITIAMWLAFSLRLGEWSTVLIDWWIPILFAPLTAIPVFIYVGFYRLIVRHLGYQVVWLVAKGVTLAVLGWTAVTLIVQVPGLPRSVIFIYWFTAFALIAAGRLWARAVLKKSVGVPVAVYGAGSEGVQLTTALQHGIEYRPVVFLDDDPGLQGSEVANLRVYPPSQFQQLYKRYDIKEVLITIAVKTKEQKNKLVSFFDEYPLRVRILPLFSNLTQRRVNLSDFEQVSVEDLLGRDQVPPDKQLLTANIQGKSVMVTGAGGSIGSELCRQIIRLQPAKLILFEQSEYALYQIEQNLYKHYPLQMKSIPVSLILGSVCEEKLLQNLMIQHQVETVYHAAAYKHVPIVENNIIQGTVNNVLGTLAAAQAALKSKVKTFILISTDKAVRPTSVMGASKRFAELLIQALVAQKDTHTCFSIVRFGNVLDSSGSVVPRFRKQIDTGGPVTVTHQEMTRYFMTMNEAVELVIQSGAMAKGGEVFVLDMGKPVSIDTLARTMIHLSGLRVKGPDNPDGDIEIQYIGIRPGEKLYEELLIGDNVTKTRHPKIMCSQEAFFSWEELKPVLQNFREVTETYDSVALYKMLNELSGGYMHPPEI